MPILKGRRRRRPCDAGGQAAVQRLSPLAAQRRRGGRAPRVAQVIRRAACAPTPPGGEYAECRQRQRRRLRHGRQIGDALRMTSGSGVETADRRARRGIEHLNRIVVVARYMSVSPTNARYEVPKRLPPVFQVAEGPPPASTTWTVSGFVPRRLWRRCSCRRSTCCQRRARMPTGSPSPVAKVVNEPSAGSIRLTVLR